MSRKKSYRRKVQEILTGNTFRVLRRVNGSQVIRIAGLNSPERGKEGFQAAKRRLKQIEGDTVTIKPKRATTGRRLIGVVTYGGRNLADPLSIEEAYSGIFELIKRRTGDISKDRRFGEEYLLASKELVRRIPRPGDATEDDMAFVAHEVLTGLLSWAYGKRTRTGIPMYRAARFVVRESKRKGTDWTNSGLRDVKDHYVAELG